MTRGRERRKASKPPITSAVTPRSFRVLRNAYRTAPVPVGYPPPPDNGSGASANIERLVALTIQDLAPDVRASMIHLEGGVLAGPPVLEVHQALHGSAVDPLLPAVQLPPTDDAHDWPYYWVDHPSGGSEREEERAAPGKTDDSRGAEGEAKDETFGEGPTASADSPSHGPAMSTGDLATHKLHVSDIDRDNGAREHTADDGADDADAGPRSTLKAASRASSIDGPDESKDHEEPDGALLPRSNTSPQGKRTGDSPPLRNLQPSTETNKRKGAPTSTDSGEASPTPSSKRTRRESASEPAAVGLDPILASIFASPFLLPSYVERLVPLLRGRRVTYLASDELEELRRFAATPRYHAAIVAPGLSLSASKEHRACLPAYTYKLDMSCSVCQQSLRPPGCLVVQTGPLDWHRDIRDLDERPGSELPPPRPVVELFCLRTKAAPAETETWWSIEESGPGSSISDDPPPRTFRTKRLFARLSSADGGDLSDPVEIFRAKSALPTLSICLAAGLTYPETSTQVASASAMSYRVPPVSRAHYLEAWNALLPSMPAWLEQLGRPDAVKRRDELYQAISPMALLDSGKLNDLWTRTSERFRRFGVQCSATAELPLGQHLAAGVRIPAHFGRRWESAARSLFATDADIDTSAAAELPASESSPSRGPEYARFGPRRDYHVSQIALLAMRSWCDALARGTIARDLRLQPRLLPEPYLPSNPKSSQKWLTRFEADIRAAYDFPAGKDPLFFLGFIHDADHWIAWHVCHKARLAFLYDGTRDESAQLRARQFLKPVTDAIDRCRGPPGLSATPWYYANNCLIPQRLNHMCGPWTSHVIELCLRHASDVQLGPLHPGFDDSLTRGPWSENREFAMRLYQAASLLIELEEGVVLAEHAWRGRLWADSQPTHSVQRNDDHFFPVAPL